MLGPEHEAATLEEPNPPGILPAVRPAVKLVGGEHAEGEREEEDHARPRPAARRGVERKRAQKQRQGGEAVAAVGLDEVVPVVPADLPGRLRRLCEAALALEPGDRPQTAELFRRTVQTWLEERDADGLADAGRTALAELESACARGDAASLPAAFAAVRVACEQALVRAPEHPSALATLDRACLYMVEFELEHGTPRAAAAWLAEVRRPPAGLGERIQAAAQALAEREAAAASLLADFDTGAGVRTRAFVTLLLGIVFVFAPLLTGRFARDAPMSDIASATALVLVVVLGLWFWARDSLSRSVLNRAFIRTTATVPALHLVLIAGADRLGLDVVDITVLLALLAASTSFSMAANHGHLRRRLRLAGAALGVLGPRQRPAFGGVALALGPHRSHELARLPRG